jgi:hypothetical protein
MDKITAKNDKIGRYADVYPQTRHLEAHDDDGKGLPHKHTRRTTNKTRV